MITIGILKDRKKPLAIRKISDIVKQSVNDCARKIQKINSSNEICSCPECKSKQFVRKKGSNNGINKFGCNNPEHSEIVNFSSSTSFEAIDFYRESLIENICLLVYTNSTVKGMTKSNECTKYFIEYALEGMCEFIEQEVNSSNVEIKLDSNLDLVAIFMDLSGSGFAKNKAIILGKIQDKILFNVVTTSNHLSSYELLAQLKNKLQVSNTTKIVFITDGEVCFVDSIRHHFPDSIHIRQFHSQSCKGMIYVHLKYQDEYYTLRCLWDAVLNDGTASKETIKHRERKAKSRLDDRERHKDIKYSELSKDNIVWKGTVYEPKGIRRKIGTKKKKENTSSFQKQVANTSSNVPPVIFRGSLEDAKKNEVFAYCFEILKKIFGGLYITSNIIETVFNIKSKLYPHRAIKFGKRILLCILYAHFVLKNKNKQELIQFIKDNIITYDFVRKKVLYNSGLQKNKISPPSFKDIINGAFESGKKIIIHYCDAFKKHTVRMITVLKITSNEYNKTTTIEAFCHLRNEKRTFYLERIRDVSIYDTKPILL